MADDLMRAALNAAATLDAVYQWVDRVEAAGGATSIQGVAACHAMLTSFKKNRARCEAMIMAPLRAQVSAASLRAPVADGSTPAEAVEARDGEGSAPHALPGVV